MRKIKADDYYNNGIIELARFGKNSVMKNIMTKKQHQEYITKLKSQYPELKKEIDDLVLVIREKVTQCNPTQLLCFAHQGFLLAQLGKYSEIQSSAEDIAIAHITEYIQSILVSSPSKYIVTDNESDPSYLFFSIQNDIVKLYELINVFYQSYFFKLQEEHPDWNNELTMTVIESQILYNVRGQRYQIFEIEYFENLLNIHNEIFIQLFNLSSYDIIEGIKKLQYALTQGKFDALNSFDKLFDEFSSNEEINEQKSSKDHQKEANDFLNKFFGTKLFNVTEITGWDENFISELSYGINEVSNFFNESEFSGWPVIDLPIQKRPFIKLDNKYYCFDYYSFVDNFYRSIQKMVARLKPKYKWADNQKTASEKMVENIFLQLLPECKSYRDNYYPKNGSTKQLAENDLLILYSNVLIIVEVKAGSFVYTPPLTDYEAHIKSYKSLLEKADWQCKRTSDYLLKFDVAPIYNKNREIKDKINMSLVTDVIKVSVTVDNINDFAARAEKLNFLQLKCNAISIAVDDLMVYREYFDSPLFFLHFLKQRELATQEQNIALNDELDHLGMYINHNCYTLKAKDTPNDAALVLYYGYREDLDKYFSSLYHSQLKFEKPKQKLPQLFLDIISILEKEGNDTKVEISSYLLDFTLEAKEQFCTQIEYVLEHQSKTKNMIIINANGCDSSLRYSCFINQPGISLLSNEQKREHVLASLIWNKDIDRTFIDLYFDEYNSLYNIKYNKYSSDDVNPNEVEDLKAKGEKIAKMRIEKYKQSHTRKIGRNSPCPCGSGKKYKKCCGK